MQFPSYDVCSSMLLLKFFVYPKQDGAHRNHNQKTRQVAAYMTLKKWKIIKPSAPNSGRGRGRGRLQEVAGYETVQQ